MNDNVCVYDLRDQDRYRVRNDYRDGKTIVIVRPVLSEIRGNRTEFLDGLTAYLSELQRERIAKGENVEYRLQVSPRIADAIVDRKSERL